jgi:uncharacterized protein (UPF0147 family)
LFLLSSLFGLAGTAMIYIPSFMEVLLSYKGLITVVNKESADILDSCLNGDGSLRNIAFSDTTGYLDTFDKFYNNSYILEDNRQSLSESTSSLTVKELKDYHTEMQTNIILAPEIANDPNSPIYVLDNLTDITSTYYSTTLDKCSAITEDIWVSSVKDCDDGYNYVAASSPDSGVGSESCLNVREWKDTSVQSRYTNRNKCGGISNVNTVSQYVTAINKYATESSPVLNDLNLQLDE